MWNALGCGGTFFLQLCPSLGSSSKYDHHLHIRSTSYCRMYNLWNSDRSYHTYSRSLLHRIFRSASSCTFHTTWFHLFLRISRVWFLCRSLKIPRVSFSLQLQLSLDPFPLFGSQHSWLPRWRLSEWLLAWLSDQSPLVIHWQTCWPWKVPLEVGKEQASSSKTCSVLGDAHFSFL